MHRPVTVKWTVTLARAYNGCFLFEISVLQSPVPHSNIKLAQLMQTALLKGNVYV